LGKYLILKMNFMKRCNIFNNIHKGLRAMLYQTAALLQQTDFNNPEEAAATAERVSRVVDLFNNYTALEKPMIAAAIYKNEPAFAVANIEGEMERAVISQQVKAVSAGQPGTEDSTNGAMLQQLFTAFMLAALRHLASEESTVNRALWLNYTDASLYTIAQQMESSLPAESLTEYNRWMLRGLNNDEISSWLKEVKNTAPDAAFTALVDMACKELNEHRWQLIREAITDGAMLA